MSRPRPVGDNCPTYPMPLKAALAAAVMLPIFWAMTTLAFAEVSEREAVRAIVGEAANQPFDGMVAVGEVIRRRGSVAGMVGYRAMDKRIEDSSAWKFARLAWILSADSNLSKGATFFENIYDFGFPESWDRERFVCVAHIGSHWFFEEVA